MFFWSNEGLIIIFIIGLFIFGYKLLRPTKSLLLALGIWMGYFTVNTLIIKSYHPFFMATYIIYIIIAWWLFSYYKEKLFIKYENAVYILSIISLIFYLWQVSHFESLYSVIKSLDLSQDLFPVKGYASILVYSIVDSDHSMFFPRNCGFAWEPGPFSSYVALALFFNLARNKRILKDKLKLSIFLLVILTTQSTTGIFLLFAIILWLAWSYFKNNYVRLISIPIASLVLLYVFINNPLLQEKIISDSQQNVGELIDNSIKYNITYNPGRFASLQLGWIDFKNHPIAGYGGHIASRYAAQQGANVATINGLAAIMARYGSIGLMLFLLLINSTGKWLSVFYSYKGYFIFPSLILIISFGFGVIETPMFVTLWISSVFLKQPSFYIKQHYFELLTLAFRK